MKCPRCGAEVEAKRFCIFCGENLQSRENLQVRRASSGVMRIRHRSSISQTALPEVQKRSTDSQQRINLASLNGKNQFGIGASSFEEMSKPVIPTVSAKEAQEESRADKRSRELEALLGSLSSSSFGKIDNGEIDVSDELREMNEVSEEPRKVQSMNSFDINLNEEDEGFCFDDDDMSQTNSLSDAFFDKETSSLTDVSETLPVGSGTFARVPSNVFHPIWESIKSACEGMVQRIQSLRKKNEASTNTVVMSDKQKKLTRIALLSIIVVALLAIVIVSVSGGNDEPEITTASQASAPVPGSEPFDIIAQDDENEASDEFVFNADDDFSIPALDNDEVIVAQNDVKEEVQDNARLTELRLYGKKDNVLSVLKPGESYQSKNTCVVREGPASRFGLVKQVSPKTKMLILADVEEDWVLESGGVWTKAGETPRLGPGKQFANAVKGMSIPQPKSRVISAKKWKYVQVGDLYGYVGPACFK